jgi:protoporphyrinogen oxidase
LYACDLSELDTDAMGRFFPYADVADIIRNFKRANNSSYNATFNYPKGGAIEYIKALKAEIPDERISLGEQLLHIDLKRQVAVTNRRRIAFVTLVSSAPFNRLLQMAQVEHDPAIFTSNKVLVFNLGFNRKGWDGVHWVYFPERKYCFYRVGFYDNIFGADRMSLYVEIGLSTAAVIDVAAWRQRVLEDLAQAGVITDHQLVSFHAVVLDPAYVHITHESQQATACLMEQLNEASVYSIGRYGGWKYCSIEDNIVEAQALVEKLES